MKKLGIITKGETTCKSLVNQLKSVFEDKVEINGYYLDRKIEKKLTDDVVVLSGKLIYQKAKKYLHPNCKVIIARRSINYDKIDKLFDLPEGTDVLLVNDIETSAYEAINLLKELGIDHVNYYPYYPGIENYPILKTVVTPGELHLVPNFAEKIIDIKSRNIDITTMVEILYAFDLLDEKANLLSARYIKDIISLIKRTKHIAKNNNIIKNRLQTIIDTVDDGIVAVDEENKLTTFNHIAENIFGVLSRDFKYKDLTISSKGKEILSKLDIPSIDKEGLTNIRGRQYFVSRSHIGNNEKSMGVVYILKDVTEVRRLENEHRRQALKNEAFAQYTFDDIAGESKILEETKKLAKKIAKSSSPILIQGESGTGKELFAQAIHNVSPRKKGPFVAVNFAALPKGLIESVLFGYEEGAFTGAKKGGMMGLFEQAHGGTIFLDEIGDAPLHFQVRLLRVLQEKQVRRVGSKKVIPIDVRVISATNKNLRESVQQGKFRADLFYRLNVLPLNTPSLRDRREDILYLAEQFYFQFLGTNVKIDPVNYFKNIKKHLYMYSWPGNIRELSNVVEYLVNICSDKVPNPSDLPEGLGFFPEKSLLESDYDKIILVLKEIEVANKKDKSIGRRSLASKTGISESRIRKILEDLEKIHAVEIRRGVKGLKITKLGKALCEE